MEKSYNILYFNWQSTEPLIFFIYQHSFFLIKLSRNDQTESVNFADIRRIYGKSRITGTGYLDWYPLQAGYRMYGQIFYWIFKYM
jgi:hypothetical protein